MDKEARNKIEKARTQLVLSHPFFGSLSLRMPLEEDPSCETAWTDGKTQGYNPEWVKRLEVSQIKGALAHEAAHVLFLHNLRRKNRDHGEWNEACDFAVNDILLESKFELPTEALYDPAYKGMSAESVFNARKRPDPDGDEEGDGGGGGQDQNGGDSGEGQEDDQGEDQESPSGDPGGCGEVRDAPSEDGVLSEAEISQLEAEMKIAAAQARQLQTQLAGEMPGGLGRLVSQMIEPLLPWREVLWRYVQMNAKNDFSWQRPNRRYIDQGLYLPSLMSAEIDWIVVAIDTSGSHNQDDIDACASELTGILETFPTRVSVVYCDTELHGPEEFTSQDLPVQLHPAGGGGTSFIPPFEWIDEQGLQPTVVIYLTDGECSRYPENEPSYSVLWIGTRQPFTPPWGEMVMMREQR